MEMYILSSNANNADINNNLWIGEHVLILHGWQTEIVWMICEPSTTYLIQQLVENAVGGFGNWTKIIVYIRYCVSNAE